MGVCDCEGETILVACVHGGLLFCVTINYGASRTWARFGEAQALQALDADIEKIIAAARDTARQAGLKPDAIDALYFTGGSTGLRLLAQRIAAAFPKARAVRGDRFASVANGLGVFAQRWYGRS